MTVRAAVNEWGPPISSVALPGISTGPTITPGNNVYGAYTQLIAGASVTDDVFGIWINVNGIAVSGVAKDAIAKIGIDPAGGTSYADFIIDLGASCAISVALTGGGVNYFMPIRLRAGTSIACAVSVNNATVGTASAYLRLQVKPKRPWLWRSGSYVRTYGSTPASSSGTAITPGNGAKGTFVQVGTVAAGDYPWGWCLGMGLNNTVFNNNPVSFDLAIGDATTKRIVIADLLCFPTTNENLTWSSPAVLAQATPGDQLFVRAAGTGAPVSGWSAIAYGIGG